MTTRVTGKYSYNAMCQVCRFKKKAGDLRLRWDGLWVCAEDWEPRNILDFYRPRNDVHQLPFILPDDNEGRNLVVGAIDSNGIKQHMVGAPMVGSRMVG